MSVNARKELLSLIEGCADVKYVHIEYDKNYSDAPTVISGTLEKVLPLLGFDYNNGFGNQKLEGTVWFEDGTWAERAEYDGSEWWEHRICPPLPKDAVISPIDELEVGQYVIYKGKYYLIVCCKSGMLLLLSPEKKVQVHQDNVIPTPELATLVIYRDAKYLVTPKRTIISLTTHRIMKWGEENGDRKAILQLASNT